MTVVRSMSPNEVMEVTIPVANIIVRIEVRSDKVLVSRIKNSNYIIVYEEYMTFDKQWHGRINPLADYPTNPKQWKSDGKCDFCGNPMPPPDRLAAEAWIPSYWSVEDNCEILEPVCGNCVSFNLVFNKEIGDFEKILGSSRGNHQGRHHEPFVIYVL